MRRVATPPGHQPRFGQPQLQCPQPRQRPKRGQLGPRTAHRATGQVQHPWRGTAHQLLANPLRAPLELARLDGNTRNHVGSGGGPPPRTDPGAIPPPGRVQSQAVCWTTTHLRIQACTGCFFSLEELPIQTWAQKYYYPDCKPITPPNRIVGPLLARVNIKAHPPHHRSRQSITSAFPILMGFLKRKSTKVGQEGNRSATPATRGGSPV